ncbi:hypothetical protein EVAR_63225_1 [Eumeta japonica]|uniref:Uncharacterized protein n=1 Tax=Eumeta variegata TaxID=151549 RepID=A0A4C1ZCU0_EUMVA|nr:hypothetical protein EVAR_63225_1 [Eumeta japonica]
MGKGKEEVKSKDGRTIYLKDGEGQLEIERNGRNWERPMSIENLTNGLKGIRVHEFASTQSGEKKHHCKSRHEKFSRTRNGSDDASGHDGGHVKHGLQFESEVTSLSTSEFVLNTETVGEGIEEERRIDKGRGQGRGREADTTVLRMHCNVVSYFFLFATQFSIKSEPFLLARAAPAGAGGARAGGHVPLSDITSAAHQRQHVTTLAQTDFTQKSGSPRRGPPSRRRGLRLVRRRRRAAVRLLPNAAPFMELK